MYPLTIFGCCAKQTIHSAPLKTLDFNQDGVDMGLGLGRHLNIMGLNQNKRMILLEKHVNHTPVSDIMFEPLQHLVGAGSPSSVITEMEMERNICKDYGKMCNLGWVDPPLTCDDYEGQKAGGFDNEKPVANRNGRTDVEGCCWWGRGVIQTTGICNFGKLNYYLGARAQKEGRKTPYGDVDFCKDPEIICSIKKYTELKWIAGMFYWMESVQKYDVGNWNYMTELRKFVDGGFKDRSFIDSVSGIVNRGCHNPPCGTGAVDGGQERYGNFVQALSTFKLIDTPKEDKTGRK